MTVVRRDRLSAWDAASSSGARLNTAVACSRGAVDGAGRRAGSGGQAGTLMSNGGTVGETPGGVGRSGC